VTLEAPFASSASAVRIDGERTSPEPEFRDVLDEVTTKLVARNERVMDDGRGDAAVLIVVQVAPADSDCRHVDEDLVRPAFAQIEWGDPDIPGAVKENRVVHRGFCSPPPS
jgi:hypothetical protein